MRHAERTVVAVAYLQAVASGVAACVGVLYALESASPDNGSELAELGVAIGIVVAVLGAVGAAFFALLAVGLRRRFRQRRHVFALAQALLLVWVLQTREAWTWPVALYLMATAVLCYAGRAGTRDVEDALPAPSQGDAAASPGREGE